MVNERVENLATVLRVPLVVAVVLAFLLVLCTSTLPAQESDRSRLREPVFRVEKELVRQEPLDNTPGETSSTASAEPEPSTVASRPSRRQPVPNDEENAPTERLAAKRDVTGDQIADSHPLDPAIAIARKSLAHIEANIRDYKCVLVKRERVNGALTDHEFMSCKIRQPRRQGSVDVPFSVYLRFRRPDTVAGREVIYIAGENEGKITAHEGGLKGRFIPTVSLLPTSALAMRGNRYPITEIGLETLTRRLIEKGERDRKVGECQVRMVDGAKVAGRVCTMLEVHHAEKKPEYDFHKARVFLDNELNVPIRYEAYDFPARPGETPPLLEEYTYMNLELNVGLSSSDFDIKNPKYGF